MKSLKESIFGDIEDIVNNDTVLIEQFLKDNYEIDGTYNIKDGAVDVTGDVEVKNKKIESLTNGLFRFEAVSGGFYCFDCSNLKSLKGAPRKVGDGFDCHDCRNLKTIKDAPKEVGGNFWCYSCWELTSLKGAPEKVEGGFYCHNCPNLATLKGAPKEVSGRFNCSYCPKLKTLEGAPKELNGPIYAFGCDKLTITDQDKVKYSIFE